MYKIIEVKQSVFEDNNKDANKKIIIKMRTN